MAYILKFQVVGDQEAINKTKRVYSEGEKSATASAGKIKDRFRDVFENVTQNATSSFGSVAGGLFKLPGPAGIAAAAILGIGGAALASAKKFAEANAANDAGSAKFLATIEGIGSAFSGLVNFIGSNAVTAFNALADAFGLAATQQEILLRQEKAYNDLIVKQVNDTDAYIKKLNEILDADARLLETGIIRDYFAAFAAGNTQLANAYAKNLRLLREQQSWEKILADATKQQPAAIAAVTQAKTQQLEVQLETNAAFKIFEQSFQRQNKEAFILLPTLAAINQVMLGIGAASVQLSGEIIKTNVLLSQQEQIGQQIFAGISQSLAAAVFEGEKLGRVLENILKQLASRALARLIFGGLGNIFGGGIFAGLGGLLGGFQHGGSFTVGGMPGIDQNLVAFRASRGERVTITPANQSTVNNVSNAPNISININARNFDRNFVRTELVPLINREVKNGLDLFASKLK